MNVQSTFNPSLHIEFGCTFAKGRCAGVLVLVSEIVEESMVQAGFFKLTKKQRKFTTLPASFDAYDLPSRTMMTRTLRASKLVSSLSSEP